MLVFMQTRGFIAKRPDGVWTTTVDSVVAHRFTSHSEVTDVLRKHFHGHRGFTVLAELTTWK